MEKDGSLRTAPLALELHPLADMTNGAATEMIERILCERDGIMEGFALEYMRATGYDPSEIVLCQMLTTGPHGPVTKFYFEHKDQKDWSTQGTVPVQADGMAQAARLVNTTQKSRLYQVDLHSQGGGKTRIMSWEKLEPGATMMLKPFAVKAGDKVAWYCSRPVPAPLFEVTPHAQAAYMTPPNVARHIGKWVTIGAQKFAVGGMMDYATAPRITDHNGVPPPISGSTPMLDYAPPPDPEAIKTVADGIRAAMGQAIKGKEDELLLGAAAP